MPIIRTLWQRLYVAIAMLSWGVLAAAFVFHATITFLLLRAAGESDLIGNLINFAYYYVTTATTVGYGDLSPSGRAGRLVGTFFVLPGSIALFTAALGKAIADIGGFWRKRLQGLGDFSHRQGHVLVIGWQEGRTRQLVEGLIRDSAGEERIVLLAPNIELNPMAGSVDFVRAQSLSDQESYARAGAQSAATLVVRGSTDDDTLAATLAARAAAPSAHLVSHFQEDSAARLIRNQLPDVEVITSIATELLVRAARDPGASRLAALMFSGETEDTAYSMKVPDIVGTLPYYVLLCGLKERHDITVIGVGAHDDHGVDLNCPPASNVRPGDTLFYIADQRVDLRTVDWESYARKAAS